MNTILAILPFLALFPLLVVACAALVSTGIFASESPEWAAVVDCDGPVFGVALDLAVALFCPFLSSPTAMSYSDDDTLTIDEIIEIESARFELAKRIRERAEAAKGEALQAKLAWLNQASEADLLRLPGIGKRRAARLVARQPVTLATLARIVGGTRAASATLSHVP